MWKVFIVFCTHRLFLFIIALAATNYRISAPVEGKVFRPLRPFSILLSEISSRISNTPEVRTVIDLRSSSVVDVFRSTNNILIWLSHFLDRFLPIAPAYSLMLISNVFFFLFLWELQAVVSRFIIPEVGTGAASLMVLWVTSYELTLGSSLAVPCFLLTMSIRHAVDNRWFVTGLGLAFLAYVEPFGVFILPVLLLYFWQFQRHFPGIEIVKNLLFFLLPCMGVVIWKYGIFLSLPGAISSSALFNVLGLIKNPGEFSWALSKSFLGQTITLGIFVLGAFSALILNTSLLFRMIPAYTLAIVLMSTSYGALASRLMLAGTCLGGISAMSSVFLTRLIQLALLSLGATEVAVLFSS